MNISKAVSYLCEAHIQPCVYILFFPVNVVIRLQLKIMIISLIIFNLINI